MCPANILVSVQECDTQPLSKRPRNPGTVPKAIEVSHVETRPVPTKTRKKSFKRGKSLALPEAGPRGRSLANIQSYNSQDDIRKLTTKIDNLDKFLKRRPS